MYELARAAELAYKSISKRQEKLLVHGDEENGKNGEGRAEQRERKWKGKGTGDKTR
jgi:hypothetical protein